MAEFPPHPPSAKPEHRIEPRHLLEYLRAETRRKILFSLEEKEIGRAQNEKSKEYFPAGHASGASGGGAVQSSFRSKKVRAKDIISPPIFTFCEIVRCCLGAKRLGMVFFRNFDGVFEIARQRAVGNAEVRTNLF